MMFEPNVRQADAVPSAASGEILEVSLLRELFELKGRRPLLLSVAIRESGLPVDVLPTEGTLEVALVDENFTWKQETGNSELLPARVLDERLGLILLLAGHVTDDRRANNMQLPF
jgi:hypothetical protein